MRWLLRSTQSGGRAGEVTGLTQDVVWWSRVQNGGCGARSDPWVITEC